MGTGVSVSERVGRAENAPADRAVREGFWVMDNGLVTVDVGLRDAWLLVNLFACQYGGVTPECDTDLTEAGRLIRELGYTRTGVTKIEDETVHIELI